jgi:hypothetical protein
MSSVTRSLRARVEFSPTMAALAAGDLLAIAAFVGMGVSKHGQPPTLFPLNFLGVYAEFLVGWVVVSVPGGLYAIDAIRSPRRVIEVLLPAWLIAVLIAQGVRATPFLPGDADPIFALVAFAGGLVLLSLWRLGVTAYQNRLA